MLRLLDQAYRCLATGFCFACIFVGGSLLAATVMPLANALPGAPHRRSRDIVRHMFRFYIGMLQFLGLARLEIDHIEELRGLRGKIVIANHPSLLDVVILMAYVPNAQCIIKSEIWGSRYLGSVMRRNGYIRNDLAPEEMIAACRRSIDAGENIIIFPEGTRSRPGEVLRMQRGFANIATLTGAEIQPVVITCTPPTLMKGQPWWMIPERPPLFQIRVGKLIGKEFYSGYRSLASRRLTTKVETYYAKELANV